MVKKQVIIIVREFIEKVVESGINIDKAYLYGSYAYGVPGSDSDIDVLLVGEKFDQGFDNDAGEIWLLSKSVHDRIEPYMVGTKKFSSDFVSPLLLVVREKGLQISFSMSNRKYFHLFKKGIEVLHCS